MRLGGLSGTKAKYKGHVVVMNSNFLLIMDYDTLVLILEF